MRAASMYEREMRRFRSGEFIWFEFFLKKKPLRKCEQKHNFLRDASAISLLCDHEQVWRFVSSYHFWT